MVAADVGRWATIAERRTLSAMPDAVDVPIRTRAIAAWDAAADRRDDSALGFLSLAADRTISALGLEPGMHVLDVASGTGTTALLAGRAVAPGGRVVAVDLSDAMLEVARDKVGRAGLADVVELRRADMTATGLPSASFDAVVCVFGLVLVPDMPALARELWRMVKPGGQLAITTWGPRLWAPMTDVFKAAVAAERPDLVPPSDPWDRATDTTTVAGILTDAGIPEDHITVVPSFDRWPLRTPRDWWSIVMGTGLRWTVDQLTDEGATRVRQTTFEYARRQPVDWIACNVLYARATKPLG